MSDTDTLRSQVTEALRGATDNGADRAADYADAVLAVVQPAIREAQAEAWDEGTRGAGPTTTPTQPR